MDYSQESIKILIALLPGFLFIKIVGLRCSINDYEAHNYIVDSLIASLVIYAIASLFGVSISGAGWLPIFIILSLIAEILGTVGGFGSSVFFVPVANFFLDFQAVLGITALYHVSSNITKIAFFRKGLDKKVIVQLGIPAVVFVIVGGYLSQFMDPKFLTYLLGIFLVAISLVFLVFKKLVVKATAKNAIDRNQIGN